MAKRPDNLPNEEFIERLIQLDEAVAGETPALVADTTGENPLAARLRSTKACLELIERVRRSEPRTPADDDSTANRAGDCPDSEAPPQHIGRFEIVRELGRGGYGIVFLARDPDLERDVALKVPRPEVLLTPELRQRFVREAKAAAALDHAHVVPVFEAGSIGAIGYLASAYCPGMSLAEWLAAHAEPVSSTQAARLLMTLAEAVQHAHGRGVLHRDLKPNNILLESPPSSETEDELAITAQNLAELSPKISDFGLAKFIDASSQDTRTTAILGTPAYMAPEQAAGRAREIGPAADVYALGAILYELLTRQPPLKRDSDLATLQAVQSEEPPSPRRLRPDVPRDLEAICLKCLEKEPSRRYDTATALAADLNRFLECEPIRARPITTTARLARWCRRNPLVAGLAATAGLLLVAVAIVSSAAAWRLTREQTATRVNLDRAVRAEGEAHRRLFDALIAQARAARGSGRAGQRFDSIESLREAMSLGIELDDDERRRLRNGAIASLSLVDLKVDRTWSVLPLGSTRHGLAFDPLLQRFARFDKPSENVVVYRLEDQQPILQLAAGHNYVYAPQLRFGPRGKYLGAKISAKESMSVWAWNLEKPLDVLRVPAAGAWFYSDFDISPRGDFLAVAQAGPAVVGYDLRNASEVFRHAVAAQPVAVRYHPQQAQLAVTFSDRASLLDLDTGDTIWTATDGPGFHDVDFHPDGSMLAMGGDHGAIRLIDTTDGHALRTLRGHRSAVVRVNFNHDGTLLASTSWDTTTRIWDPHSGEQLLVADMPCHSFSRDDAWLGIGAFGPLAGRWTLAPPREYQTLHVGLETERVRSLDVGPRGHMIAAGLVGQIVIWTTSPGAARVVLPTFGGAVDVAFEANGRGLISSDSTGVFRRSIDWHPQTSGDAPAQTIRIGLPQRLADAPEPGYARPAPELFMQGLNVRCARSKGSIEISDARDERQIVRLAGHAGVTSTAISTDREWVATATARGRDVVIWNAETGKPVKRIECGSATVAFAPDGATLAVGTSEQYAVYKAPSWDPLYRVQRTKNGGLSAKIAFSADGSLLAVCDEPWIIRILDAASGREVASLVPPTTDIISALSFRRATGVLAAATETGTVHCWDLARIRRQLADLHLDWQPPANWANEESDARPAVRFDAQVVSPLTAVRSLALGDHANYRQACKHLQQEFPASCVRRLQLIEIAMACTTAAGGLTDAEGLLSVLEQALKKSPFHHDLVVPLMAARHRTGNFTEVLKLARRERLIYSQAVTQPRFSNWVKGLRVLAFAHLAMTHQQLDQTEQARQRLAEAERLFDEVIAIHAAGDAVPSDLPPERFVEARVLLAEAREMIEPD